MSHKAHNFKDKARSGDVLISENVDFNGLLLSEAVLKGLNNAGFSKPSPIQLKAIPLGRCGLDLIVQAKSGTGKTCVFSVIALESIVTDSTASTQVLVLAPTREIAVQICEVITSIGSAIKDLECHTFIGGLPLQEDRLKLKKCHIAVGSPGRIKQLIETGILKTDSIRLFILDEADKLLEDSFQDQINWIYSTLPDNKQMLALSATYPEYLADHLTAYMRNPTFLRLNISDPALLGIRQYYQTVPHHPIGHVVFEEKCKLITSILTSVSFQQCLIFSNLQTRAQTLAESLSAKGWPTACIAGCLDQRDRNHAMAKLKSYKCRILISTDLTSRGIDADKVNIVMNLDVPKDHETYLHRIGRAGRFGSFGVAISLVSEGQEKSSLDKIEKQCNTRIRPLPDPIPSDLAKAVAPVNLDDLVTTSVINNMQPLQNIAALDVNKAIKGTTKTEHNQVQESNNQHAEDPTEPSSKDEQMIEEGKEIVGEKSFVDSLGQISLINQSHNRISNDVQHENATKESLGIATRILSPKSNDDNHDAEGGVINENNIDKKVLDVSAVRIDKETIESKNYDHQNEKVCVEYRIESDRKCDLGVDLGIKNETKPDAVVEYDLIKENLVDHFKHESLENITASVETLEINEEVQPKGDTENKAENSSRKSETKIIKFDHAQSDRTFARKFKALKSSLAMKEPDLLKMFQENVGYKKINNPRTYSSAQQSIKAFRQNFISSENVEEDFTATVHIPKVEESQQNQILRQAISDIQTFLEDGEDISTVDIDYVADEELIGNSLNGDSDHVNDGKVVVENGATDHNKEIDDCKGLERKDPENKRRNSVKHKEAMDNENTKEEVSFGIGMTSDLSSVKTEVNNHTMPISPCKDNGLSKPKQRSGFLRNFAIAHLLQDERLKMDNSRNELKDENLSKTTETNQSTSPPKLHTTEMISNGLGEQNDEEKITKSGVNKMRTDSRHQLDSQEYIKDTCFVRSIKQPENGSCKELYVNDIENSETDSSDYSVDQSSDSECSVEEGYPVFESFKTGKESSYKSSHIFKGDQPKTRNTCKNNNNNGYQYSAYKSKQRQQLSDYTLPSNPTIGMCSRGCPGCPSDPQSFVPMPGNAYPNYQAYPGYPYPPYYAPPVPMGMPTPMLQSPFHHSYWQGPGPGYNHQYGSYYNPYRQDGQKYRHNEYGQRHVDSSNSFAMQADYIKKMCKTRSSKSRKGVK